MSSRDAGLTALAAKETWAKWQPGDGSAYQVWAPIISSGPARGDRVLLLNVGRQTVAFQFSLADYRHSEIGPWTATRAQMEKIPFWAWRAAEALLAAYGVTSEHLAPLPAAIDVPSGVS